MTCELCRKYFSLYDCGASENLECDCPKCQGMCRCVTRPLSDLFSPPKPPEPIDARLIVFDGVTDTPIRKHPERIRTVLRRGAKSVSEIHVATKIDREIIAATLRRMKVNGVVVQRGKRPVRWALK